MSRTRRFLSAVSLGYLNQALILVTGLWLTPFLLHRVGQQEYGLWLVGLQFTFYLTLLDVGIIAVLPRTVAFAAGRVGGVNALENEVGDLPAIIGQTIRLVLWQVPAAALLAGILFWTLPSEWALLRKPLGLIILGYVVLFPFRVLPAILQGLQDMTFIGITTLLGWVVNTGLTVILVLLGWRLQALAIGWLAQQTMVPLLCWIRLRVKFRQLLPHKLPRLTWQIARDNLSQGLWVSVAQIAQLLLNGTDLIVISKLLGSAAVVPYACTSKLISVMANQPQTLMQYALPALSEMRTSESRERLQQVMSALSLAMIMMSGLIACAVLVTNQGFVGWWVGTEQFAGFVLSGLFLIGMLLRHWNTCWIYSLFCFGYERRLFVTNLVEGLVAILATYLLVRKYGLIGGPIGIIVGLCLVSLPLNLMTFAKEVKISVGMLFRSLWPWAWRFLVVFVLGCFIALKIEGPGIYFTAITGLGVILMYGGLMLPVLFTQPLADYVLPVARRFVSFIPAHPLRERLVARLNCP